MGSVTDQFFEDVLVGIGAPRTTENLRACHAWQVAEGGNARFNPFNTTQPEHGDSYYNSFGPGGQYHVRNYPDSSTGINATVQTLKNGHYQHILDAFHRGSDGAAVCSAVDASPWGTHGAHATYLHMYGQYSAHTYRIIELTHPYMRGSDVRQAQQRLMHFGYNIGETRDDAIFGDKTERAVALFQKAKHMAATGRVDRRTRVALGMPS